MRTQRLIFAIAVVVIAVAAGVVGTGAGQSTDVSGTITNPRGQQKVTGTVTGNQVVFGFETTREGQPFKASYRGTVELPRRMTGEVEFSGVLSGTGTWVATRD